MPVSKLASEVSSDAVRKDAELKWLEVDEFLDIAAAVVVAALTKASPSAPASRSVHTGNASMHPGGISERSMGHLVMVPLRK